MTDGIPHPMRTMLTGLLQPWHDAVENPATAQEEVLHRLLKGYAQTEYGAQHGASQIETVEDYRRAFPIGTYDEHFKPLVQRVMAGEVSLLLDEQLVGWAVSNSPS